MRTPCLHLDKEHCTSCEEVMNTGVLYYSLLTYFDIYPIEKFWNLKAWNERKQATERLLGNIIKA